MAIDFPAAPVDGQVFSSATNGVVYKYSTAYTSWLAQNAAPAIGGTGDFCATNNAVITYPTSVGTIILPTIRSGNSGLWYNTTTGRYTPPAGRYFLVATAVAINSTSPLNITISIAKNGTTIASTNAGAAGSNIYAAPTVDTTVDANGSDYFELQAICGTASSTSAFTNNVAFTAFPLTGLQGPTGGAPGPVVGDFFATVSATYTPITTAAPIPFNTVKTGNSGGYLNLTNGRYTPPAGRYYIFGSATFVAQSATVSTGQLDLRKNGVAGGAASSVTMNGNFFSGEVTVSGTFDANGSDYFEIYGSQSVVAMNCAPSWIWFGAYPTQGMVGPQGPMGPAGVTQTVFTETGAVATGTTNIPADDTIPQITEGNEFMTLAITPQSATSKLIIEVSASLTNSVLNASLVGALFQDSTANALAAAWILVPVGNTGGHLTFRHIMTSGSTSPTTFRFRAGANSGGTTTFNGQSGARLYGGSLASSIVIREVP